MFESPTKHIFIFSVVFLSFGFGIKLQIFFGSSFLTSSFFLKENKFFVNSRKEQLSFFGSLLLLISNLILPSSFSLETVLGFLFSIYFIINLFISWSTELLFLAADVSP